jgi:ribonuclease III
MNLDDFQTQIGVQFRNIDLLRQSLTHSSFINEHEGEGIQDNERMEFLGDAILGFLTGDMLYHRYSDMPEGELTRVRSALVRTESLAELAQQCRLGEVLLIGKGEENSGGRTRVNNLCRGFEALIGALYLDQGLKAVEIFVLPRLTRLLQDVMDEALHKDARSQLQEWSQAELSVTPEYRTVAATGPDHEKEFLVEVLIADRVVGRGTGRSKQAASQVAARAALDMLEKDG